MIFSLQRPALWLSSALLAACAQAPVDHAAHAGRGASPAHQHASKEPMCEMGARMHEGKHMPVDGQQRMAEKHQGMQEHMAKMHKDCPAPPAAAKP